jgi:transcriptional regulator with XRE-family HTH domain
VRYDVPSDNERQVCAKRRCESAGIGPEFRRQRGWTQQDAAEHLRMPLKNLQRIEAGMNLTLRTLVRVARGLGVRARVLLDEPGSRPKRKRGRPSNP